MEKVRAVSPALSPLNIKVICSFLTQQNIVSVCAAVSEFALEGLFLCEVDAFIAFALLFSYLRSHVGC